MSATFVDAHVHFHPAFDLSTFLDAAVNNVGQFAKTATTVSTSISDRDLPLSSERSPSIALLLAEITGNDPLAEIRKQYDALPKSWQHREHEDGHSITFQRHGKPTIVFIAGRQIVVDVGLELLALCTNHAIQGGQMLEASIEQTLSVGGVPVIPWGFGKWWFRRGRLLREFLLRDDSKAPTPTTRATNNSPTKVKTLLGDNGCRPSIAGRPSMLQHAETTGFSILAGSDPLALRSHQGRVGSFGSLLSKTIDADHPTEWMRRQLLGLDKSPPTFGHCRSLTQFAADQIRVRMK